MSMNDGTFPKMNPDKEKLFLSPSQEPLIWPEPPPSLRRFEVDDGMGKTYEFFQFPTGRKPCYDDMMLLVSYDKL